MSGRRVRAEPVTSDAPELGKRAAHWLWLQGWGMGSGLGRVGEPEQGGTLGFQAYEIVYLKAQK